MNRPLILMLEHDTDDQYITRAFFEEHRFDVDINFVGNSDEFLSYLEKCVAEGFAFPSLILLNLYATPLNATELLKTLKSNSEYNHIPVVVLSDIKNVELVKECYELGASSFIQKPSGHEKTNKKILSFLNYWFETVELC